MNSKIIEKIIVIVKNCGTKAKKVIKGVKELKSKTKKTIIAIKEMKKMIAQGKVLLQEEEIVEKIELTPEEIEELESAAYVMSRKWKYHKLMLAASVESARFEGREVHGYMMRMFRHRYDWLIDNDVFDLAVDYAIKYYIPEIFNVIKHYDFDNAIINIIHLPRKVNFDIYSDFGFDRFIVLTHVESFENAVYWIENHPWTDDEGYNTTKTLAPCNFLNMGFTLWDLPVLVLKDVVGKDRLFFEAKTTADQIVDVREQILKKHIYTKREKERTTDERIMQMEIRHEQLEERHQYLIDDIKAGDTRNPEEKLKDFAKKYDKEVYHSSKIKKVVIGIIIVLLITILIIVIITMYLPKPEISDVPEIVITFVSIFVNGGC